MLRSLVGSEMCIRDSGGSEPNTHFQNGITAAMLQWGVSDADIETFLADEEEATPVSYTHLTLPTIYSV